MPVRVSLDTGQADYAAAYLTSDGYLAALDEEGSYQEHLLDLARLEPEGLSWLVAVEPMERGALAAALVGDGELHRLVFDGDDETSVLRLGVERRHLQIQRQSWGPLAMLLEGFWRPMAGRVPQNAKGAVLIAPPVYLDDWAARKLGLTVAAPLGPRSRLSALAV